MYFHWLAFYLEVISYIGHIMALTLLAVFCIKLGMHYRSTKLHAAI